MPRQLFTCGCGAILSILIAAGMGAASALAAEPNQPKPAVSLTVYPEFAMVTEIREVDTAKDGSAVLGDLPATIVSSSLQFEGLTYPATRVKELRFRGRNVGPYAVAMDALLDKQVVLHMASGNLSGVLLGADYPLVTSRTAFGYLYLRSSSGQLFVVDRSSVRYIGLAKMPGDFRVTPQFECRFAGFKPGRQMARLSYQVNSIDWKALYILILDEAEGRVDLSAWAKVSNHSGKAFPRARLKLIAGDITRIHGEPYGSGVFSGGSGIFESEEDKRQAFFEYHVYLFSRPVSLGTSDSMRIELFEPVSEIKLDRKYVYEPDCELDWLDGDAPDGEDDSDIGVFIELPNTRGSKLGIPIPGGTVSIYKRDPADRSLLLVGENEIDNTPAGEKIRLQVGNAFDLVGRRICTDVERKPDGKTIRESVTFTLRNRKERDVTVRIKEPLARGSKNQWTWSIVDETLKHTKLDSRTVAWDVPVKAGGEAEVTYTAQYVRVKDKGK